MINFIGLPPSKCEKFEQNNTGGISLKREKSNSNPAAGGINFVKNKTGGISLT